MGGCNQKGWAGGMVHEYITICGTDTAAGNFSVCFVFMLQKLLAGKEIDRLSYTPLHRGNQLYYVKSESVKSVFLSKNSDEHSKMWN